MLKDFLGAGAGGAVGNELLRTERSVPGTIDHVEQSEFNGIGEILSVKIDGSLVNPDDVETLEDSILLVVREGFAKTGELRKEKMAEITGGLPIPPGMSPF